ncbi:MAG: hypothetical protein ACTHMR_21575 [Thermomicrobiales bacterium]
MTYPLRLTDDQWQDVREHYADDAELADDSDLYAYLCYDGSPCDGTCAEGGCPAYEQAMRRSAAQAPDLDDSNRDAIPF